MKTLIAAAVLLCASTASAQWVAPNTYVMPGMGYTQSMPPNPYYYNNYNYYQPQYVQPFMPPSGGVIRMGRVNFYDFENFGGTSVRLGRNEFYDFRPRYRYGW